MMRKVRDIKNNIYKLRPVPRARRLHRKAVKAANVTVVNAATAEECRMAAFDTRFAPLRIGRAGGFKTKLATNE